MYNVHMLVIKHFLDSINNKGQRKLSKEIRHYFMASLFQSIVIQNWQRSYLFQLVLPMLYGLMDTAFYFADRIDATGESNHELHTLCTISSN